MKRTFTAIVGSQQFGICVVILLLGSVLTNFAGTYTDRTSGAVVNTFLNANTIFQVLTDTSVFAIMAVGATIVIISGGIDLSVGAIYALASVVMAMVFKGYADSGPLMIGLGFLLACGIGVVCGALNGIMICGLGVHPFIITLGTMLLFRGVAFVLTKAQSILLPTEFTDFAKATFGMGKGLYPVPMLMMIVIAILGWLYLTKTVAGRNIYAVGGNLIAAQYSGIRIKPALMQVYAMSGLTAGIAAFLAASYYGSASSGDGSTYELIVIASAVVGGASLLGGKGSAISALLGALLITLMKQSVITLHLDQNYQNIIVGFAIIAAVVIDRLSTRFGASKSSKSLDGGSA
ncbi:MAG: ABC transporter permease [Fimbriimonadaceae bacterium]|nr:ABC transporter permease [Fimbriimonadaceae bacterium]